MRKSKIIPLSIATACAISIPPIYPYARHEILKYIHGGVICLDRDLEPGERGEIQYGEGACHIPDEERGIELMEL